MMRLASVFALLIAGTAYGQCINGQCQPQPQCVGGQCMPAPPAYPQTIQGNSVIQYVPQQYDLRGIQYVPAQPRNWVVGQAAANAMQNSVQRRRWFFGRRAYYQPQYVPRQQQ